MWQSDNDDDGNKGVRINYVMEFGNYGYSDEMTGAGWQTPRIGWESEIPQRHWHQNDPGVVPNMLMTGAGSPTGMQVYEGDLLPSIFHGQPLHCDAGPNVVRGYITQPDGAGYKAEIVNILEGSKNRWFRPSDVAVAPDGSLIVADWYDPGVGGHGMGDVTRGRLFRVTTKAAERYKERYHPAKEFKHPEANLLLTIDQLCSPNEAERYMGWIKLKQLGDQALPRLEALFENKKAVPQHRARALWSLASLSANESAGGPAHSKTLPRSSDAPEGAKRPGVLQSSGAFERLLTSALTDPDPNIRITAIRVARQLWQQSQPDTFSAFMSEAYKEVFKERDELGYFKQATQGVTREMAIALRHMKPEKAIYMWLGLAGSFGWSNKWMTEAVRIGADHKEGEIDLFFEEKAGRVDKLVVQPCLLWLGKTPRTPQIIMNAITEHDTFDMPKTQLLRSLQLLSYKHPAEVSAAALTIFLKADAETALASTALLDRNAIASNPEAKARLEALLKPVIGKPEFIDLVQRLNLTGFEQELVDYITAHPDAGESINAARILAANTGKTVAFLTKADAASAKKLVAALGKVSDRPSVAVLNQAFWPEKRDDVRRSIVEALALSSEGGRALLKWNSEKKLPEVVKTTAALALSRSTDAGLRQQAAKELPLPAALGAEKFPSLAELMKVKADGSKGQAMFMQAGCVACHQVKGQFINFGPDLSQIGNKLSKDGLFTAILYPSAAVEHSFGGLSVTTKEGLQAMGYVISETADELTLKIAGGAAMPIKKASIVKKDEMKESLMPPGLAAAIGPQGLADLVAYLQTLK
jgi:putative heme-binding domain-containing protein